MTGLELKVGLGVDCTSATQLGRLTANDNPTRDQDLFELCISRELVDDCI